MKVIEKDFSYWVAWTVFENKAPMALIFTKTRAWSCPDPIHGQAGSMEDLSRIEPELGFEQNTKVVGLFEI